MAWNLYYKGRDASPAKTAATRRQLRDKYEKLARSIGAYIITTAPCCHASMTPAEFERTAKIVRKLEKRLIDLDYTIRRI